MRCWICNSIGGAYHWIVCFFVWASKDLIRRELDGYVGHMLGPLSQTIREREWRSPCTFYVCAPWGETQAVEGPFFLRVVRLVNRVVAIPLMGLFRRPDPAPVEEYLPFPFTRSDLPSRDSVSVSSRCCCSTQARDWSLAANATILTTIRGHCHRWQIRG